MHNLAIKALGRTEHVKHTHYFGDGAGRDNYIIMNNGGLIKPTSLYNGMEPPTDYMRKNSNSPGRRPYALAKDNACVYYPSDGSGRDYYIAVNNGGTCASGRGS